MSLNLSAVTIGLRLMQRPAVLYTPGGYWDERGIRQDQPLSYEIKAVIQAATQKDLAQASDGYTLDGYVRIYTEAELRTVDDDLEADAQTITTPEGVAYRIVKAGRRSEAGFTRAIGRLIHDRGRSV